MHILELPKLSKFDREMALMDYISEMESSREEGFEEGQKEMIKAILEKGFSIKMIAEISKLSIEEIEKIAKEK